MDLATNSALFVLSFIFIVALIESIALFGVFVPGAALIFSLTVVASQNDIPLAWVLMAGTSGAVLGDALSYKFGTKLEDRLADWPWFRKHQNVIEQGHWFFQRWGWISIILGRLLGPLRPITPFVAGTMGMPQKKFALLDIIAVTLWAPVYLLPGYFTGELHELWQLQPLNDRSLIIYSLSAMAIIFAFITVYHHTHPEALQLKGWLSKKQAEFWPIQAMGILLLSFVAMLFTMLALPKHLDLTFASGVGSWQNYKLYDLWHLFDAGQQSLTAALSLTCISLWLMAQLKWKILFATLLGATITVSMASSLHAFLGLLDPYSVFLASTVITFLIGFMSIIHANQLKPHKRWLVYFVSSLVVLMFSISHLWIGSLNLSSLLITIWLGLIGAATTKLLWHFIAGPANFSNPLPLTALLIITVYAYSTIKVLA